MIAAAECESPRRAGAVTAWHPQSSVRPAAALLVASSGTPLSSTADPGHPHEHALPTLRVGRACHPAAHRRSDVCRKTARRGTVGLGSVPPSPARFAGTPSPTPRAAAELSSSDGHAALVPHSVPWNCCRRGWLPCRRWSRFGRSRYHPFPHEAAASQHNTPA